MLPFSLVTQYGGGLSLHHTAESEVKGSKFFGNRAARMDGGGIYTDSDTFLTTETTIFEQNSAGRNGGGIYYDKHESPLPLYFNSFVNNSATNGGALYATYVGHPLPMQLPSPFLRALPPDSGMADALDDHLGRQDVAKRAQCLSPARLSAGLCISFLMLLAALFTACRVAYVLGQASDAGMCPMLSSRGVVPPAFKYIGQRNKASHMLRDGRRGLKCHFLPLVRLLIMPFCASCSRGW